MKEETKIVYGLYFKNSDTNKYELCKERKDKQGIEDLLIKIRLFAEQPPKNRPTWYGKSIKPSFDLEDYKIKLTKTKIVENILEDRWVE